jgi:hypothetical protein
MKSDQLPFVSNTSTTGHKLQGCTKDQLYIPYWHYRTRNWPYVVISRVQTAKTLFIGELLHPTKDSSRDPHIVKMLSKDKLRAPESIEQASFGVDIQ